MLYGCIEYYICVCQSTQGWLLLTASAVTGRTVAACPDKGRELGGEVWGGGDSSCMS